MVKIPPAARETCLRSLHWEDPLVKRTATHSSVLAWRIPMDRGAWQVRVHGVANSQTWLSNFHFCPIGLHFGKFSPIKIFLPCPSDLRHTPLNYCFLIYPKRHSAKYSSQSMPPPIPHPCEGPVGLVPDWPDFSAHPVEAAWSIRKRMGADILLTWTQPLVLPLANGTPWGNHFKLFASIFPYLQYK